MTNTEKISAEIYDIIGDYFFVVKLDKKERQELKKKLSTSIHQAIAEDRERVRATLPKFTIGKCFSCEECPCKMKYKDGFNGAIREVDDLLSSKTLTTNQ